MKKDHQATITFNTDKERKRLALALVAILDKSNLTEVIDLALDLLIAKYVSPDLQAKLLQGDSTAGESPPSGESHTRRPRPKDKAA